MKRSIRNGFLALLALTSAHLSGCTDDRTEQIDARITIECDLLSEDYIMLPSNDMDPSMMTVSSTHKWLISKSDLDWLTVTPVTGAAGTEMQVIFSPEINTGDERQGTLLFSYGGKEKSITVIQGAFVLIPKIEFVDFDGEPVVFDYNGSAPVTVKVKSNVAWSVTASVPDVVQVSPTSGAANQVTSVTITPLDNSTTEPRSTMLTFKNIAGDEQVSLTVNQAEYPSIPEFKLDNIDQSRTLKFSSVPGEKSFDVTANFDWEVQGTIPSWLEVSPTTGVSDQKVTVTVKTVENNTTGSEREFTFVLAALDTEITLTENIRVIQGLVETFYYDDMSWCQDPNATPPFSVIGLLKSRGRPVVNYFGGASAPQYISTGKTDPLLSGMDLLRGYTDWERIRIGESGAAARYSTPYFNGVYPARNVPLEGQTVMPDFMPNTAATLTFKVQHFGANNSTVTVNISYSDGTPTELLYNTGAIGKLWTADPFQNWYVVTVNITAEQIGVGNCRIDIGTASGHIVFIDDVRLTTADPTAVNGVEMLPAENLIFCRDARPTYVTDDEKPKILLTSDEEEFGITIDHNVDFEIASKPDWVSEVSTGAPATLGGGSRSIVTLKASINDTGSSRSGVIVVRGSVHTDATHSLTVIQP